MDSAIIEAIRARPLNWQFGASFMVSNPQDTLRRAIESFDSPGTGYGFGLNLAYYFDPVPVVVGAEFSLNFFGGSSRMYIVPQGPFVDTLEYETLNTHLPLNLYLRFQPNLFTWVYPYGELVGGFSVIGSSLNITRSSGSTQNADSRDESGVSWQYGFGAGIMFKVVDIITLPNEHQRVLLDVRFRYLKGSEVDVPVIKLLDDQTFVIQSQPVPEPTLIHFNLGLAVQF
jgi:opacity protein-like surface antigen